MNYYEGPNGSPLGVLGISFIAIEASVLYLAASLKAYMKLRWKVGKMVSKEDKIFINDVFSGSRLSSWIEFRKLYGTKHTYRPKTNS